MSKVQIFMANNVNQLIDSIELNPKSVFQKTTFITQTAGINHYLKLKLAEKYGVVANQQFLTPNELIMDLAHWMGNLNSAEYSTENIRWRLYKLLNDKEFKEKFPFIGSYFGSDDLKRIQLATKLADLFDQYIVFRTDMMIEWQTDSVFSLQAESERESWQKWLWLELKKQIAEQFLDKAQYQREIIQRLEKGDIPSIVKQKYPEIHVFGLTVLTKFHLELLWNLRYAIDVNFYFVNPCVNDFWYDCISEKDFVKKWSWHKFGKSIEEYSLGNELLTSWGKVSQELFAQLFSLDDEVFSVLQYVESEHKKDTLLQTIQNDLYNNFRPVNEPRFDHKLLSDKSIQIKANYTEAREVEVLYDYLLDLIENHYKGSLQPHDVVVMMPDVEKYLPYIKAVFDHAPKRLPYSIGDRPVNQEQSLLTVCLEILSSYSDDFTSEKILKLLDYELVRKQYQLSDIDYLRQLVKEANIRFGVKGDKLMETHLVAWEQGLVKLLMSVFMRDQSFEYENDSYQVLSNVEGQNNIEQALNFVSFVRRLIDHASRTKNNRALSDWNTYLMYLVNLLADENEEQFEDLEWITKKLDALTAINDKLNGIEVSFETYLHILKSYHANESENDGYFRGRITFCQALPMRSIPFKVVAFLGLNAGDFPRQDTEYAFDLIKMGRSDVAEYKRKLGDRSTKDNDKYLFLEAILNAEDFFYLSYLGKNIKNNKDLNPSIVVEELLDYIEKNSLDNASVREKLIVSHPLSSDSIEYQKNDDLFTYLSRDTKIVFEKYLDKHTIEESENQIVELKSVLAFYKNPQKYYYQKVLGIYLEEDEILLSENELFELNKLQEYQLKQQVLFENKLDDMFILAAKKDGVLPLKNMAKVVLEEVEDDLAEVKNTLLSIVGDTFAEAKEVNLEMQNLSIKGLITGVYEDKLLRINFSKPYKMIRTSLGAYIEFLCLGASGLAKDLVVLDLKNEHLFFSGQLLSLKQYQQELEVFIDFYLKNRNQLVAFSPMTSEKAFKGGFVKEFNDDKSFNEYLIRSEDTGIWEDSGHTQDLAKILLQGYMMYKKPLES